MSPDTKSFYRVPEATPERQAFYGRLSKQRAAPLWEAMDRLIPPKPEPAAQPSIWRYRDIRPLLMESGELFPAGETERRVLMLENPGLGGRPHITESLYAGIQLVMPGEIAPSHRHVTAALRLVFESDGAYTTVNGNRMTMEPGDLILTPSWTFHGHGNPTAGPAIWLDCLDLPMVNFFETSFAEHDSKGVAAPNVQAGGKLHYRYRQSRRSLDQLHRNAPVDPSHGFRLEFPSGVASAYPVATIGTFLQLLPEGFQGKPYRATDARIFCVLEGSGESQVETTRFTWNARDTFVVPSWCSVSHASAGGDSVLFSFSDRPAQVALGLWREETSEGS